MQLRENKKGLTNKQMSFVFEESIKAYALMHFCVLSCEQGYRLISMKGLAANLVAQI